MDGAEKSGQYHERKEGARELILVRDREAGNREHAARQQQIAGGVSWGALSWQKFWDFFGKSS